MLSPHDPTVSPLGRGHPLIQADLAPKARRYLWLTLPENWLLIDFATPLTIEPEHD